jgi:phage-related protein
VTCGRDPDHPSFELAHPAEAAASLNHTVEHFTYGAGFSHDARLGLPHWSKGWRASVEAERNDQSIRALALTDAHSGARSFTSMTYRAEGGASFGRDPRTLRLALTVVDQALDDAGGTFLVADLQALGGGAGLGGFDSGRFRDLDLALVKLSYIFPLVKNLEFDLHTESGGVYPDLRNARIAAFESSFGAALRFRTEVAMFGALGYEWSSERSRVWFKLGGVE